MVFSYTGSFTQTQLLLAQQGHKSMFSLRRKVKQLVNINSAFYSDLFYLFFYMVILSRISNRTSTYIFFKSVLKVKRST